MQWPGMQDCHETYDPRFRDWSRAPTHAGPKDVVIASTRRARFVKARRTKAGWTWPTLASPYASYPPQSAQEGGNTLWGCTYEDTNPGLTGARTRQEATRSKHDNAALSSCDGKKGNVSLGQGKPKVRRGARTSCIANSEDKSLAGLRHERPDASPLRSDATYAPKHRSSHAHHAPLPSSSSSMRSSPSAPSSHALLALALAEGSEPPKS